MKKLIALDIDGTLLNSNHQISRKTKDTLSKAMEKGHKVVLVSGRAPVGVFHLAEELNFEKFGGLISGNNGATIINYRNRELVSDHTLDLDLVKNIFDVTKDLDASILLYRGSDLISSKDNKAFRANLEAQPLNPIIIENIRDTIDYSPNKIIFVEEADPIDDLITIVDNNFKDMVEYIKSLPFLFEIMPKGLSKGKSLLEIAELYGIDQKDIIAFGDEMNDVTMLEVAGIAVAMGNAVSPIKEIADYVTLSNDEDGIADYLEKFVL